MWENKFASLNPEVYAKSDFNTYYTNFISEYATMGRVLDNYVGNQETMVNGYDNQRLQLQGVSSDEELEKMIKFQQAYNAASRYINVVSDMLESLIVSHGSGCCPVIKPPGNEENMASTFFGLTISYSGLQAASTSLNVTGHNVSNINTKGYSKQQASTEAAQALRTFSTYGMLGAGVKVTGVSQLRDSYYDEKYRNNQANYGEYEAKENYMDQIEDFFDEWNLNGYCKEYQKFFTSVEEVIKAPGEASTKNQLINNAASMAQYFNTLSTNLRKIQEDANNEIKDAVEQINSYAQNIASLNRQINQIEANYGDANDLRDKRNALIDDLAQIVNVSINEEDIGNGLTDFRVSINGQTLVAGYDYNKLYTEARADKRNASDAAALYDVKWESGQNFNLYSPSLGGQMKALVDIRDGCNGEFEQYKVDENGDYILDSDGNKVLESVLRNEQNTDFKGIPYYQSQLNQFISTLSESVNNVLKSGLTSDGTQHGISLFVTQTNTDTMTALNITVNPELVKDADKLATRSSAATGQAEADIMEQLRKLQSEKIFDGGTGAYFLESMVSDMSIDSSNATNMLDNYNNLRTTIQNQRLSIMGVDTDEEAMDMMKFQQAYNLNSKMMSVMNEIYDKLINGTGL